MKPRTTKSAVIRPENNQPKKYRGCARYWGLKRSVVFLNHGSFGACPLPILALQSRLRRAMEAEPVQFLWRRYEERLEPSRKILARFIGAKPQDLVFVTNATTGINAVVRSLQLGHGDELLTTNLDYNACHNVLVETARWTGARLTTVRVPFPIRNSNEIIEAILDAVTSRTRLAMIDHVTSGTAMVLPVKRIIEALETRGIDTLIDGAHAPGMVPLDLRRLRPTYYTGNLHKWVCAPKGAAFLWVRPDRHEHVHPAVISHGHNTPRPGYRVFQDRFDWAGTQDPTPWFCVGDAIGWMDKLVAGGWRQLMKRNRDLLVAARRFLCQVLDVEPPCPEQMLGSMATIPLPARFQNRPRSGKIDDEQLALYDRFGIEVPFYRAGESEQRFFRISAQVYNTLADYSYLADCLRVL
jgi:isopenicillin-N epimerase